MCTTNSVHDYTSNFFLPPISNPIKPTTSPRPNESATILLILQQVVVVVAVTLLHLLILLLLVYCSSTTIIVLVHISSSLLLLLRLLLLPTSVIVYYYSPHTAVLCVQQEPLSTRPSTNSQEVLTASRTTTRSRATYSTPIPTLQKQQS